MARRRKPPPPHLFLLPVQAFAGGNESSVEVGQAAGTGSDSLQVKGVAALQVLVRNRAEAIGVTTGRAEGE